MSDQDRDVLVHLTLAVECYAAVQEREVAMLERLVASLDRISSGLQEQTCTLMAAYQRGWGGPRNGSDTPR